MLHFILHITYTFHVQVACERLGENDFAGAKTARQAAVQFYKLAGQDKDQELQALLEKIESAEQLRRGHMQAGLV